MARILQLFIADRIKEWMERVLEVLTHPASLFFWCFTNFQSLDLSSFQVSWELLISNRYVIINLVGILLEWRQSAQLKIIILLVILPFLAGLCHWYLMMGSSARRDKRYPRQMRTFRLLLFVQRKGPCCFSDLESLSLFTERILVMSCSAFSFLINTTKGLHLKKFLIRNRPYCFRRGCIWYWTSKPPLCLKAATRKQLVEVEISFKHTRKGTKKPHSFIGRFLCEIWLKCFLISTAKDLNSSHSKYNWINIHVKPS